MTFLDYFLARVAGPPRTSVDRPVYRCPFRLDDPHSRDAYQVVVNDPLPGCAVKARCYRGCGPGPRGCFDAIDVLRAVYGLSYAKALVVEADFRRDYEATVGADTFSPHGAKRWAELGRLLREREEALYARLWLMVVEWFDAAREEHLAQCTDPECEYGSCRKRRVGRIRETIANRIKARSNGRTKR